MRVTTLAATVLFALAAWPARSDSEAPNATREVTSPDGHCLAVSTPKHDYDPAEGPRQQGETLIFRLSGGGRMLIEAHDWYSGDLHVLCGPGAGDDVLVVRLGPWPRGRVPYPDDLAIAFYRNGRLLHEYSTFDIAGGQEMDSRTYQASVSHYRVFESWPELVAPKGEPRSGVGAGWTMRATTIDGRALEFEVDTGRLR